METEQLPILKIGELAFGGDGVGRTDDGRVVFVPFVAPGDTVGVGASASFPALMIATLAAAALLGELPSVWVVPGGALVLGGQSWVSGHASPELGVVMISIPPGPEQGIEFERQVPHELTHVLLYQSLGPNYNRLPIWLTEGLATTAEIYPNPDLEAALAAAVKTNSLLPLADLCAAFPPDTGRAFLAYAQSQSFVRFLLDNYGATGFSALISAYADGMDCEQGARRALEQPLSQLEARWRESALGENRSGVIAANLFPYLLVLGVVLFVPVWGALGRVLARRKHARHD